MKIMLACSAGMSTSLIVSKMQKTAKERGLDAEIWAIPESQIGDNITKCDVILLGPQVRFLLNKAKVMAAPYGIPVDVIDMRFYGMCNGAKILDQALTLLEDK